MALRVWIPFTQDLRNLGINPISIVNHSTSIVDGGKLGKACSFNGSSTYLEFSSAVNLSGDHSICCWIDLTNINSIQYFVTLADNAGIRYGTDNTFLYYTGSLSADWSYAKVNRFVHVAFVCSSDSVKLYIDGTQIGSNRSLTSRKNCVGLGRRRDGYYYNGKINDFRIYDKALSETEVKEISKGLVCHYTLSDNCIVNKNLLGEDSIPIDTKVTVGLWYTSFKDSSDFFGLLARDTFSVSCYVTCPAAKGATLRIQYYTDGNNRISVYGTTIAAGLSGLLTYTGTLTAEQRAYTKMLITILNSNTSVTTNDDFYVRALKIEKFNSNTAYTTSSTTSIIYDSSGYCNNGTISGNPSLDSNTPRYNKALLFPANSASTITTPLSIDNSAWTISFWEKYDWTNTETSSPYILYWGNCIRIRKYSTTARMRALFYYKDSEGTQTNALPYFMNAIGTDTSWKHFALTFDGSTLKTYLNGTLNASANLSSGFSLYTITGNLVLNYTTETIAKSLSDFRVYTTALSADDVAELYNLRA